MKLFQRLTWLHWLIGMGIGIIVSGTIGVAWGYSSGLNEREKDIAYAKAVDIQVQYRLGVENYQEGNYELAKQRFEYVVLQNPDYPGVVDMLAETLIRISESGAEITGIPLPSATTLDASATPVVDTRAIDEFYTSAEEQWLNQEWKNLIQTIISLRDIDPLYRAREVDRMLFLALRFSGIDEILNQGNLEGGLYDLALVEKFAPLDKQARVYQEWARLYVLGVSFWGIFPEKSLDYFSQLTSTAPYLRDLSGIYAKDRYRMALLQYGDQLAKAGDWCLASEQYELAYDLMEDGGLQPTMTYVADLCLYGSEDSTSTDNQPTSTLVFFTSTPSAFLTDTPIPPAATSTVEPSLTPSLEITPTATPSEEITPEPEMTPTPSPTTEVIP